MSHETEIADAVRDRIAAYPLTVPVSALSPLEVITAGAMPAAHTVARDWLPNYELTDTTRVRITVVLGGTETVVLSRANMQERTSVALVTQKKFDYRTYEAGTVVGPNRDDLDAMTAITQELRRLFEDDRELLPGTWWDAVEDSEAYEPTELQQLHQFTNLQTHRFITFRSMG